MFQNIQNTILVFVNAGPHQPPSCVFLLFYFLLKILFVEHGDELNQVCLGSGYC